MLLPFTPESNLERQRRFRERNPGYYTRANRARRAAERQAQEARVLAAMRAMGFGAHREPLMLPAPVEVLEIPGMNAIPATMPVREAVSAAVTLEGSH
jgi:hypothetical protein